MLGQNSKKFITKSVVTTENEQFFCHTTEKNPSAGDRMYPKMHPKIEKNKNPG